MPPEARIHTYNVLKLNEMQFMYAPGAVATPQKIRNFLLELNTLHRLLRATFTPVMPQNSKFWNMTKIH
jgi:hypothetical protein